MRQHVKRTQRDYPLSFKLAVVEQVENGEMTFSQATERHGIQGSSTVKGWVLRYGRLNWSPSPPRHDRGPAMSTLPLTPEQRIKELEQQLAESQIKAQFFEAVVNVMNTEFGATLTKKQLNGLSRKHRRRGSQ